MLVITTRKVERTRWPTVTWSLRLLFNTSILQVCIDVRYGPSPLCRQNGLQLDVTQRDEIDEITQHDPYFRASVQAERSCTAQSRRGTTGVPHVTKAE